MELLLARANIFEIEMFLRDLAFSSSSSLNALSFFILVPFQAAPCYKRVYQVFEPISDHPILFYNVQFHYQMVSVDTFAFMLIYISPFNCRRVKLARERNSSALGTERYGTQAFEAVPGYDWNKDGRLNELKIR